MPSAVIWLSDYALAHQELFDRAGAAFGERLVVVLGAGRIGVALDDELRTGEARVGESGGNLGEIGDRVLREGRGVLLEVHEHIKRCGLGGLIALRVGADADASCFAELNFLHEEVENVGGFVCGLLGKGTRQGKGEARNGNCRKQ